MIGLLNSINKIIQPCLDDAKKQSITSIDCTKNVAGLATFVDPTGLVSLAGFYIFKASKFKKNNK